MITPSEIELELVKRSKNGDQRAQLELYRKYVEAMFNVAIRMVARREDAEDIIQEVFITVFQKIQAFRGESTLGAWIKRITINATLNFIRKRRDICFLEDQLIDLKMLEVEVVQQELRFNMSQIHHAIKALPEGCRIVFSLFLLEGYAHQEIAEILGITISTSKTQYRRAKILLKKKLEALEHV